MPLSFFLVQDAFFLGVSAISTAHKATIGGHVVLFSWDALVATISEPAGTSDGDTTLRVMSAITSNSMLPDVSTVTSGLVAFCTAPYGVCPFLTGLVPALILTVGGHDTQVYKVKM